jgi:hypothetical protein
LLEPLEGELDLPALAVELDNLAGSQHRLGQGRKERHEVRSLEGARVDPLALLGGGFGRSAFGLCRRRSWELGSDHATSDRVASQDQQLHRPNSHFADLEVTGVLEGVKSTSRTAADY